MHQLLQEYFAARSLARQPQAALVQQEWRADRMTPNLQATLRDLADSDPLPPLPSTGWEETTMLAAAMADHPEPFVTDLMPHNLGLAGRCAAQPEVAVSEAVKNQLRWALVQRTRDSDADLQARIAVGLALGELGDPRFERRQGPYGAYLLPPLIEIPGGTYRIGSDEGLYEDAAPIHEVALGPFAIGQFPVTNAEWALFIQAGGYEDECWWQTEAAKAWRRGEGTAEGPKQQAREFRERLQQNFDRIRELHRENRITSKQANDWEQIARICDDDFEAFLNQSYPEGRQTQPAFWNDDAFNKPVQPVVGICWFEAHAYCAWLSVQTGQTFQLPTEAEWEAAARGLPCRRYAYDEDFDTACCNTFETHIRRTTPIGVFPDGDTPEGLIDMIGNTWDWTSSLYQPYPYKADGSREDPVPHAARRVVRGGSWNVDRVVARGLSVQVLRAGSGRRYRVAGGAVVPQRFLSTVHWRPRQRQGSAQSALQTLFCRWPLPVPYSIVPVPTGEAPCNVCCMLLWNCFMPIINTQINVSIDTLVKAVEQLSTTESHHFTLQVLALNAKRIAPRVTQEEAELLL